MQKNQSCYKVKVETTNSAWDTFNINPNKDQYGDYYDCDEKICYVITDDPAKIYQKFGDKIIISIEKIGFGYIL